MGLWALAFYWSRWWPRPRAVVLGESYDELSSQLGLLASGESAGGVVEGVVGEAGGGGLAFLFTGQGAQRVGMGRGLYESFPVFRATFESSASGSTYCWIAHCAMSSLAWARLATGRLVALRSRVRWGNRVSLYGLLDQTLFAQAGLFAVEVALFRLLGSLGVKPDYLIGHSVGELAAAHVAGVLPSRMRACWSRPGVV